MTGLISGGKAAFKVAYRFLASPTLATTLLISWVGLLVIWVIPFQFYGLPSEQLQTIMTEPFFIVVYVGLLIATAACMLARLGGVIRVMRRSPSATSQPRTPADAESVPGVAWDAGAVSDSISSAGFKRLVAGDGWVWGVRNRFSPLGTVIFHTAFFVVAAGALMASQPADAFIGKCVVAEGETFSAVDGEYADELTPGAVRPDVTFTAVDIEAAFHQDILLFTKLDAEVLDENGRTHGVRLGSPWLVSPTTMVGIEDFGYSVEVTGTASDSKPIASQVFKLKVFPSGQRDSFAIRDVATQDYNVDVTIYSDYVDRDGRPGSESFNLSDPRLLVTVSRRLTNGGSIERVTDRLVKVGEPIEWDGNTLIITSIPQYGVFRITRFTSAPLLFAGLVLLIAGTSLRLVWPRSQVLAFSGDAGETRLAVTSDTYRDGRLLEARLHESLTSASGGETR